ncbi:MAG: universal stress protein, partial [Proteobacteria bacterium]|nr:universal stress protein [Pseudomonadota bacterium]
MDVKKLLLPVDGSEYSLKAARYGMELAKLVGASIVLLHCHKVVPPSRGRPNWEVARDALVAEAEEVLAPFEQMLEAEGIA